MKWIIKEQRGKRKGCIVALPGRGIRANLMEEFCDVMDLDQTLKIVLEPDELSWYPPPNGANDQQEALQGLDESVSSLNRKLNKICRSFRLKRQQICLVGYSAGSVMALQVLKASKQPFAVVACLAGAILDPGSMPEAPNQTPVLIRHACDDDCFEWEERYLPMKEALTRGKYNVFFHEKPWGGHQITKQDATSMGQFIAPYLGYK